MSILMGFVEATQLQFDVVPKHIFYHFYIRLEERKIGKYQQIKREYINWNDKEGIRIVGET